MFFKPKTYTEFIRSIQKKVDAHKNKGRQIIGSFVTGNKDLTTSLKHYHLDGTVSETK